MILRFEDVSYRYPASDHWSLQNVHLEIEQGQRVLVTGASGSGKSTFCRACIGLIPHFHGGEFTGQVVVHGLDTRRHSVFQLFRHAGLVFQNPDAQLFNPTVESELVYGLESLGLAPAEIEKRLSWATDLVRLDSILSRPPHTLSGGEKQRVLIGALLALKPQIVILDEPFTHLDPENAELLRTILNGIHSEGISVIVIEHRLHEVIGDFDRLVVLYEGRVVADGSPRQVLQHDVSPYGINVPPILRLFRASGGTGVPLTVREALELLKSQNLPNPPFGKGGVSGFGTKDPVVEMEKVWFQYSDSPVLRGIHLTFTRGECVAIVGRNGAGKTTLVKHLNGLLKPNQGRVTILGHDTLKTPVSKLARHTGFAWQNPNDQLFQANVREEVLTGPRILQTYDQTWCDALFNRFQLNSLLGRSPFRLSEGQKKRVSFASALASQPELVILDEPTAGQDEPFRRELGKLIKELRTEGRTVVLVTHDLEFAVEHAGRWIAMADGEIVADGRPEKIMADHGAMKKAGLRPTQSFQLFEAIEEKTA